MASKKRQSKAPSSANRGRGGRFVSKEDAAFAKREEREKKKDKAFLKRSMEQRLDQLKYPKAKRKRVEDTRQVSTAILERQQRYETQKGTKRKRPLGTRTVGGYRLIVHSYVASLEDGRIRAQDYIVENAKRGDVVWIQVMTPNNVALSGTVPDTAPGAVMQLDRDVLSRRYLNLASKRDLKKYKWEIVIQRKLKSQKQKSGKQRGRKRRG